MYTSKRLRKALLSANSVNAQSVAARCQRTPSASIGPPQLHLLGKRGHGDALTFGGVDEGRTGQLKFGEQRPRSTT